MKIVSRMCRFWKHKLINKACKQFFYLFDKFLDWGSICKSIPHRLYRLRSAKNKINHLQNIEYDNITWLFMWVESGRKVVCISPGDKCTDEAFGGCQSAGNRFWITGGGERFRDFSIWFFGKLYSKLSCELRGRKVVCISPETSVQMKLFEAARVPGTDFGLLGGEVPWFYYLIFRQIVLQVIMWVERKKGCLHFPRRQVYRRSFWRLWECC